MKKFPVKPLALIVATLMVAPWSNSLLAQATDVDESIEEVTVTGYALSLKNSIDIKRNADTVVQAISADDLGALPDASIADALGRVPGITITRSGGQAGTIQVRGMGEGFVFSTLNGREQVSPNGTRAMEFSQFPSELIQSVEVYMSPKASLIEGGVAGTVELKTANPLAMQEEQKVIVGVRGSFNDQADDIYGADPYGQRFSLSFQKKLFDDKLGVALGYAHLVQPRSATRFEQYNYETAPHSLVDSNGLATTIVDRDFNAVPTTNRPAYVFMAEGFEVFQTGGEETRDGYVAAIQFEPNENLSIQSDVFYSKFESDSYSRGFRIQPLRNAEISNMVLWNNTAVVGGEFKTDDARPNAFNLQINSNDVTQSNELLSGGLNLQWQQDALTASLDLSHSDASGVQADGVVRAHLYRPRSATIPGQDPFERDPDQSVTYLLDGINVPSVSLSRDYTWYDSNGVSNLRMTNYERYPRINDDVISAARFDMKYELEIPLISSIEAGTRYSERNHKDRRQVFVYGFGTDGTVVPSDWSLPINTENSDVVNWKGEFSHFPSFLAIDGDAIIKDAYNKGLVLGIVPDGTSSNPNPVVSIRSIEPAARWGEGREWSMKQRSNIDENITSFYLQANLAATLFDRDLVGNVGIRHVRTDQTSVALINVDGDESKGATEICDEVGECRSEYAYQTLGAKYDHNLPSLNLNYSLSQNNNLRLALARVLSRPPINRLAAPDSEGTISIEGNQPYFNYGSNTSPFLTPFIADQVDLSFEHYMPETNGAFVVAVYHREIKSFIQDITYENFDFRAAGFDVPDTWEVRDPGNAIVEEDVQNGDYSTSINNSEGGFIRGLEISYTQTFNFLPDPFAGLGVSTSYSLTDSEISVVNPVESLQSSNKLPFPGLVEKSANFTLFYSYGAFETRLSTTYQDSFVGETRNVNLQPIIYAPETLLDYQASYKFDNGIDVIFSITNLTNEPNRSYMFDEQLTRGLQWFGRTFYVGANYTF